jgi:hypothetical protein
MCLHSVVATTTLQTKLTGPLLRRYENFASPNKSAVNVVGTFWPKNYESLVPVENSLGRSGDIPGGVLPITANQEPMENALVYS